MSKLDLKSIFLSKIATGLKHSSITTPSKWATTYRYFPDGLYSFKEFPWAREMHDSKSEKNVGQKAAQMGFTEIMLNLAFFCIDILGKDVMYVLPTKNPSASKFSSGRFDPALELSPHLRNLFSDVDNISHKRAGTANLYVVGSHSRTDLKSQPITRLIMDEVAEFVEANIPLALERVSGQKAKDRQIWMISTPTMEGFGISKYYAYSDKKIFAFPCPLCSRHIDLRYPECLKITGDSLFDPRIKDSHLVCPECKGKLDHESKSEWLAPAFWVPTVANREWSGWTVSQLYSTRTRPCDIAESYFKAQINPADEVELYNSKLGLPYSANDARVNDEHIDKAIMHGPKKHNNDRPELNGLITMGIDVGKWLHFEIVKYTMPRGIVSADFNTHAVAQVLRFGKCKNFEELSLYMSEYRVMSCVIDAQPERRLSLTFARKHLGRVHVCFFGRGINGKSISVPKDQSNIEPVVIVDRSAWLDQALGRFINGTISLPIDTNLEYREHIKAPAKSYKKDESGNPVARYLTDENTPDHYAFARCYSEIALVFLASNFVTQTIEDY